MVGANEADRPSGRTLIKRIEALVSWINAGLARFFIAGLVYRISTLVAPRTIGVVGELTAMKPRSRYAKAASQNPTDWMSNVRLTTIIVFNASALNRLSFESIIDRSKRTDLYGCGSDTVRPTGAYDRSWRCPGALGPQRQW